MRNADAQMLIDQLNNQRDAMMRQKMQDLQQQQLGFENQRQQSADDRTAYDDRWSQLRGSANDAAARDAADLAQYNADRTFASQASEAAAREKLYKAQALREAAQAATPKTPSWGEMSPLERTQSFDKPIAAAQATLQGILSRSGLTSDDPDLVDATNKLSDLAQMRDALTKPPPAPPMARVDIYGDDPNRPAGSAMVPQTDLGKYGYSMARPQIDPTTGLPIVGNPTGGTGIPPALAGRLTPPGGPANPNPLADMTLTKDAVKGMIGKQISQQQALAYGLRRGWMTPPPPPAVPQLRTDIGAPNGPAPTGQY